MKTFLFLCSFLLYGGSVNAQQLSNQVIANGGGHMETTNAGSISWTIGELFFETYQSVAVLNQGFHQSYNLVITSLKHQEVNKLPLKIYPNPAVDRFFVETEKRAQPMDAQLLDLYGRPLQQLRINDKTEVNLRPYPAGIYLLRVMIPEGGIQSFKIQKQ